MQIKTTAGDTSFPYTYSQMLNKPGIYQCAGDSRAIVSLGDGKTAVLFAKNSFVLNDAWTGYNYRLSDQKVELSN